MSEVDGILDGILERVFNDASEDIRVVARANTRAALLDAIETAHPDVVILGLAPTNAGDIGWELFAGDPLLRVLGIVGHGLHTFVYELRPQRTPIGEMSPSDLVTLVRGIAQSRAAAGAGAGR